MRLKSIHIISLYLLLLLFSCKEKVTQDQLIKSAVEIKLSQWRETQLSACRDKLLLQAESYVDSVLVATSLESKLDTISKPVKPVKPIKPAFKEKPDSVIVEKIYKKGE